MTPSDGHMTHLLGVPSESALSHLNKKPLITGEDLVILEDENENFEDEG